MSSPLGKSVQRPLQADTTGDEIQRSVFDLLCQTRGRIEQGWCLASEQREQMVHQTRVDMKRVRALLYLVEFGLEQKVLKDVHAAARALSDALSGQRDYVVMLETLDSLGEALPEACHRDLVTALGELFLSAQDEVSQDQALQLLQALELHISARDWDVLRRGHLLRGLERTGLKGEQLCRRALEHANVGALHRWRKWVKVWIYQLQWLQAELDKPWMLRLKPLGSELGRIHDLDVLTHALARIEPGVPDDVKEVLQQAIAAQRLLALANVKAGAQQVYAKSAELRALRFFKRWCGG